MEAWFYLSPFVSDRHLSSVWLILSNCFLLIFLTNYGTYSKCGGISQHGQGDGVFNIEDSMMRGKYTRAIFFSVYFLFSIAKQSTKSFVLTFSLAFMLMHVRVRMNQITSVPPPSLPLLSYVAPLFNLFRAPKKTLFQIWLFLSLFHQKITISHCTTMFDAHLSPSYARLSCKHDAR